MNRKAPRLTSTRLNDPKPFWEINLNPITMQPAIKAYEDHSIQGGIAAMTIFKNPNKFVKNFT